MVRISPQDPKCSSSSALVVDFWKPFTTTRNLSSQLIAALTAQASLTKNKSEVLSLCLFLFQLLLLRCSLFLHLLLI